LEEELIPSEEQVVAAIWGRNAARSEIEVRVEEKRMMDVVCCGLGVREGCVLGSFFLNWGGELRRNMEGEGS